MIESNDHPVGHFVSFPAREIAFKHFEIFYSSVKLSKCLIY